MSRTSGVDVIEPDWPEIRGVRALVTTRGVGNLALHTGDEPKDVRARRAALQSACGATTIVWLDQVHGTTVVRADAHRADATPPTADAAWTDAPGVACAVLTADCVPIIVADAEGHAVGIAHGGWRGLADGVVEALLDAMPVPPQRLVAWLGPAIGVPRYEVGDDVADALRSRLRADVAAHVLTACEGRPGKWLADLTRFAAFRLEARGVGAVVRSNVCTFDDARFYSHRRDRSIGRVASVIWRTR